MYNRYLKYDENDYIPPPPVPPMEKKPARPEHESIFSLVKPLLDNFRMPEIELDDILLLTVVFLLLKESGDEELILIAAALYLFGK